MKDVINALESLGGVLANKVGTYIGIMNEVAEEFAEVLEQVNGLLDKLKKSEGAEC